MPGDYKVQDHSLANHSRPTPWGLNLLLFTVAGVSNAHQPATLPHTSCPLWNVAVLGEIRATASAEQEASTSTKLASSCAFGQTRSPFSFSGNTSPVARNSERERFWFVRTNIELRVEIGFFQHVAQTIRRPVVDNAVSASHHFYAFVV